MTNVMCFKYGLLAPIENKDLVNEQIFEGHVVYNNYIAANRQSRNKKRDIINQVKDPAIETLYDTSLLEVQEAELIVKNSRIELSDKKVPKVLVDRLKSARKALKEAKKLKSDFRKAHKGEQKPLLAVVDDELTSKRKEIYNANNLFWGSDLLIRKSVDQADETTPLFNDPKFRIWKGVGQIGIQLQNNMPVEDIYKPNDWVWVELITSNKPKSRRSNIRALLHIKIQSGEKRKPVFATFPMIMHRQLPDGAKITWVAIKRGKIGPRDEWSVSFTLDVSGCKMKDNIALDKAVAIDLGWRQKKDNIEDKEYSIRVCTWVDEDKNQGELQLDKDIVEVLKRERSLSSIRKKNFNDILASLIAWFKEHDMPDWILESTQRKKIENQGLPTKAQAISWMSEWKSEARLVKLVKRWDKNRFGGDEEIFGCRPQKENNKPIKETAKGLEGWRYNDYHLWTMLESIRTSVRRRRLEQYRIFAKDMATKYKILVREDFDISNVAEKPEIGTDKEINRNNKSQSNRQLTAPSELIGCLDWAFEKEGGEVAAVNPKNTSKKCSVCGSIEEIGSNQIHTCSKCNSVWDRDFNSPRNQLKIYRERSSDVKILVVARNTENINENNNMKGSRWKEIRKLSAEKQSKKEAARNDESKHSELLAS